METDKPKGRGSKGWFPLDNAAKLYPAIENAKWSSQFRLSLTLFEPVDPALLEQAVNDTLQRTPSFRVRLRRGMFWYYLEENDVWFQVKKEEGHPCIRMRRRENGGYLFRVLYESRRISLEVFHALADGTGGLIFLKTLVAQYLRLKGYDIPSGQGVLDLGAAPDPREAEDAYSRVPIDGEHMSRREKRAYHFHGMREMPHTLHVIKAEMPLEAVKAQSKAYGATLTEYLTAVFLYTIYLRQQAGRRDKRSPVKISVPVNMRKFMPTPTLRNFAFFVNVGIDPGLGQYTFREVVELTHHYMRYSMNPKFLLAGIATNVASERNWLIRLCPLPLKNWVLTQVFHRVGESLFTTTLTNLGQVELPPAMAAQVAGAEMLLGSAFSGRSNCAALSYGGTLTLGFTRNIREADFEHDALCFLVAQGVPVTVDSNQD